MTELAIPIQLKAIMLEAIGSRRFTSPRVRQRDCIWLFGGLSAGRLAEFPQ
jgi:hypothetical protein